MKEFIRFMRFTFQGVAIASFGTMGITPSWGGFILGAVTLFIALGLLTLENGG